MLNKITKKYVLFTALCFFINPAFAEPEQNKQEQQATTTPVKEEPSQTKQSQAEGQISRAIFTSAVQNREPIDQLTILSELISEAFFFTEFKDFQDHTLTHQWSHNSKISHSIPFVVKGKRWRVFSSKAFLSGAKQEGTWTVKVLDAEGTILSESSIDYIRPSTDAELVAGQEAAEATAAKQESNTDDKTTDETTNTAATTTDESKKQTPVDKDKKTESPVKADKDKNQGEPKSSAEKQTTPKPKKDGTSDETTSPNSSTNTDDKEPEDNKADDVKANDKASADAEAPNENKDNTTEDKTSSQDESTDEANDKSGKKKVSEEKSEPSTSSTDKPIWDNIK